MEKFKTSLGLKGRRFQKSTMSEQEALRYEMFEELREDAEDDESGSPFRIVDARAPAGGDPMAPEMEYYMKKHEWSIKWPTSKVMIGAEIQNSCHAPYHGKLGIAEAEKIIAPKLERDFRCLKGPGNETLLSRTTEPHIKSISAFKVVSPCCKDKPPAFKYGLPAADYCPLASQEHGHTIQQSFDVLDGDIIAVSYVWGSPPYKAETIGYDDKRQPLTIQLGVEWKYMEFTSLLCSLSKLGWLWLDQESGRHDEMSAETVLASIPDIFKRCRVVAISWGTDCPQRRGLMEHLSDLKTSLKNVMDAYNSVASHISGCPHCSFWQPWSERLWPRQEAIYAEDLQLLQLSIHSALRHADATGGPDPAAQLINRRPQKICDGGQILRNFVSIFRQKWACFDVEGMFDGDAGSSEDQRTSVQAIVVGMRLLLGVRVICPGRNVNMETTIQRLIAEPRVVTRPCDLVLAVWCDFEGYVVPTGAKKLGLPYLLDDAWRQYTSKTGRNPPGILFDKILGRQIDNPDPEATDTRQAFGQYAMPDGIFGAMAPIDGVVSMTVLSPKDLMSIEPLCDMQTAVSRLRSILEAMLGRGGGVESMRRLTRLVAEMRDWAPLQGVCNMIATAGHDLDIPGQLDWEIRQLMGHAVVIATVQQLLDFVTLWMTRLPGHRYTAIEGRGRFISIRDQWTVGFARTHGTYLAAVTEREGVLCGVEEVKNEEVGDLVAVAVNPSELQGKWKQTRKTYQMKVRT